jgi:hypothetical protein
LADVRNDLKLLYSDWGVNMYRARNSLDEGKRVEALSEIIIRSKNVRKWLAGNTRLLKAAIST